MTNLTNLTNRTAASFLNTICAADLRWARNEGEADCWVARVDLAGGDYADLEAAAKKLRAAGLEVETSLGTIDDDDDGALYLWVLLPYGQEEILELGNGFPALGEEVEGDDGNYRVVAYVGPIRTVVPGMGNQATAVVEYL